MIPVKSSEESNLVKPAEVILAREHNPLSLPAKKLFNYLLHRKSREAKSDRGNHIHAIPIKELRGFIGEKPMRHLEDLLLQLGKSSVEITYTDAEAKQHTLMLHYLSYDLTKAENEMLLFAFDPMLLRFIRQPKVYARLNMDTYKRFRSGSAAKLYEILCLYKLRRSPVWKVSKDDLVEKIQAPASAKRTDNLMRVITKCVEEINRVSDIFVEFEPLRGGQGGRVVEISFTVRHKTPYELDTGQVLSEKGNRLLVKRDDQTIDLLDGLTDMERAEVAPLLPQTYEAARQFISEDDNLDALELQWREAVAGKGADDPDEAFLFWLEAKKECDEDEALNVIDDNTLAELIHAF